MKITSKKVKHIKADKKKLTDPTKMLHKYHKKDMISC